MSEEIVEPTVEDIEERLTPEEVKLFKTLVRKHYEYEDLKRKADPNKPIRKLPISTRRK